jgi:hypothetical protein
MRSEAVDPSSRSNADVHALAHGLEEMRGGTTWLSLVVDDAARVEWMQITYRLR